MLCSNNPLSQSSFKDRIKVSLQIYIHLWDARRNQLQFKACRGATVRIRSKPYVRSIQFDYKVWTTARITGRIKCGLDPSAVSDHGHPYPALKTRVSCLYTFLHLHSDRFPPCVLELKTNVTYWLISSPSFPFLKTVPTKCFTSYNSILQLKLWPLHRWYPHQRPRASVTFNMIQRPCIIAAKIIFLSLLSASFLIILTAYLCYLLFPS